MGTLRLQCSLAWEAHADISNTIAFHEPGASTLYSPDGHVTPCHLSGAWRKENTNHENPG
jgi:hypothetical protein